MPHALDNGSTAHTHPRTESSDTSVRQPLTISTSPQPRQHHDIPPEAVERPPVSPITPPVLSNDLNLRLAVSPFNLDGHTESRPKATPHPPSHLAAARPVASIHGNVPSSYSNTIKPEAQPSHIHHTSPPPPPAEYIQRPPSLPLDFDSNPDAAALRAAISVLQLQQQKSRRDIQTLEQLKKAAVKNPEGFTRAMRNGDLNPAPLPDNPLAATLAGNDDSEDDMASIKQESASAVPGSDSTKGTSDVESVKEVEFPTIPGPQNIVRCPPINWSKYHIIGEPLDRMHEEQRRRPDLGGPWREPPREAHVAAPYSPWHDRPRGGTGNDSPDNDMTHPPSIGLHTRRSSGKQL